MKNYVKIIRFYYELIKKMYNFLIMSKEIYLMSLLKQKLSEYMQGVINEFANMR